MQTREEILAELETVDRRIAQTIADMDAEAFQTVGAENWSAADHVKHLLLSIKPLAKALGLPREQMAGMFGTAERPSMSYDEMVSTYRQKIQSGLRAEDNPGVIPNDYRFPDGVTDVKAYLLDQWNNAHSRLIAALNTWSEADMDQHILPHPAIGMLTVREMMFFTVYHNQAHGGQIEGFA
jgi:uncharacterized damage-inducible protein DinB